jgi:UDP-4-amino-4,6-dideoxy-N-acetyl-beta-L-altrosamine N-acetyltransferase
MFTLKPLTEDYLELVLEWRNSPEIRNKMYTRHIITKAEHIRWYQIAKKDEKKCNLVCFDEGTPIGFINFYNIDKEKGTAFWGFYSGDTRKKGRGSQMEFLAIDFAFSELNINKLCCEVLGSNYAVAQFHRKFGFQIEGRFKKQFFDGQEYDDIYRLAIFKQQWFDCLREPFEKMLSSVKMIEKNRVGQRYSEKVVFTVQQIHDFTKLTGDKNSVFPDIEAAKKHGFPQQIVPGFLYSTVFSRIIGTIFSGFVTVYTKQNMILKKPVFLNQIVEVRLCIVSKIGNKIIMMTNLFDHETQDQLLEGEVEMILLK